jgi:hypothetical protein
MVVMTAQLGVDQQPGQRARVRYAEPPERVREAAPQIVDPDGRDRHSLPTGGNHGVCPLPYRR